jgi:predicted RecB family nuclease
MVRMLLFIILFSIPLTFFVKWLVAFLKPAYDKEEKVFEKNIMNSSFEKKRCTTNINTHEFIVKNKVKTCKWCGKTVNDIAEEAKKEIIAKS